MSSQSFPVSNDRWIKLKSILGNKITVHASTIGKKERVTGHHKNHRVDEVVVEGEKVSCGCEEITAKAGVEVTSKIFQQKLDISKF